MRETKQNTGGFLPSRQQPGFSASNETKVKWSLQYLSCKGLITSSGLECKKLGINQCFRKVYERNMILKLFFQ